VLKGNLVIILSAIAELLAALLSTYFKR